MPVMLVRIKGDAGERAMKLDLDAGLANEKTILTYLVEGQLYEPDVSRLFLKVLRDGDTVIDVGANIGFFTILAGTLVGSSGRVVSFEPDPANRARLETNAAMNGHRHCTSLASAVTDMPGSVTFYVNSDNSGGNALWDPAQFPGNVRSQAQKHVLQVEATTLDHEAARLRLPLPKLIKVDTEGADQRVLEGARSLLAGAAVPFVVSELHEFGLAKMNCTQRSFRSYMEGLGYSTFTLQLSGSMPTFVPSGTEIRGKYILNVLFSTPEQIARYWPIHLARPEAG